MWVTVPLLPEGLIQLEALGYTYKTSIFWHKTGKLGLGFWMRNQVEVLLISTQGKISPPRIPEPNIKSTKTLQHSEKPEEFAHLIEIMAYKILKEPKMIELFSRKLRPNWTCVGNEITGEDILESIERLKNL